MSWLLPPLCSDKKHKRADRLPKLTFAEEDSKTFVDGSSMKRRRQQPVEDPNKPPIGQRTVVIPFLPARAADTEAEAGCGKDHCESESEELCTSWSGEHGDSRRHAKCSKYARSAWHKFVAEHISDLSSCDSRKAMQALAVVWRNQKAQLGSASK